MRTYQKNLKKHLIVGLLVAYVFFCIGNTYTYLEGYDFYSKMYFLTERAFIPFLKENVFNILLRPSLTGYILGLIGFLGALMVYVTDNDRGLYRHGEEFGSARFATAKELEKFADIDPEKNIIFTRYARIGLFSRRLSYDAQKNKNILVVGGPGSGKTRTFIKPNIMQMNASMIITDPKGLLIRETGQMLADADYDIKIFDLSTFQNSDGFNIFNYIKTELDIDRVLEAITESTKKSDNKGEDVWIQAEALLLRSFIAFLWFDGQDNHYTPHLGMIADMLRYAERIDPKIPSPVEGWFDEQNDIRPDNYAYKQWQLFQNYKSDMRASVFGIAVARYSVFDHEEVVNLVREDTMQIDQWNRKKTAVFIAIPETSDTYNFLSAMFLSTIMETLRKSADEVLTGLTTLEEGDSLLHVRFLIDEFANIGRIPNIEKSLATFRSREMSIVIVLQALDQLKTMYSKGWATLINTCDSFLFLGGDEKETTEYLSKRAGKQTLSIRKRSLSRGRGGSTENRDKMARELLTPDEVGRINGNDALLFIAGQHVFKDKKYTVNNHPNASLLADSPGDINWYHYKRYLSEADELLANVNDDMMINHGVVTEEAS